MIKIPNGYELATPVPKKGARCTTCKFLSKSGGTCMNKDYQREMGTNLLVYNGEEYPAKRFCCMFWMEDTK